MPDPTPPVIQSAEAYRAALARQEQAAFTRLITAYQKSKARLQDKIDLLIAQIGEEQARPGQIVRLRRYRELMRQVNDELKALQVMTTNEVEAARDFGLNLGSRSARDMMSQVIAGSPEIAARFNTLPKEAIIELLGYLQPGGALYERLELIAPYNTQAVSDAIVTGAGLGYNPRKIAAQITRAYGAALTDGLRFVRTAQLYAYRETNRATYMANSDVVSGWIWHANLGDTRTCMSCVNMHGTEHELTERLNDHYNGRCAMIPMVPGYSNPVTETGQEWFEKQSEATQRQMMGKGRFEAWKDGRFEFSQLTRQTSDAVYGNMRSVTPLKDLTP